MPFYPPEVSHVLAVDPALHGRDIATKRVAVSRVPITYVGLDGQALSLEDETVDNAIVTWTLCTIPDADKALREICRVLRPGGSLHFVEHGRSEKPSVAKWQDRITPVWGKVFGGCCLNRPIPDMIRSVGLQVTSLSTYRAQGPELVGRFYEGTAVKRVSCADQRDQLGTSS